MYRRGISIRGGREESGRTNKPGKPPVSGEKTARLTREEEEKDKG